MARPHPAKQRVEATGPEDSEVVRELQEKLRRYELIFQATNDVLYDLNLQDATVEWNEALYTQYGYKHDEPVGTLEWWTGHIHENDALRLENRITELFESDANSWQHDYRFRRSDGRYNYVRDRGLLLRDDSGKPVRIIGSLLDITAQKQLDIAKDEFIALVSHQLRTPLTVIRVYGDMLTSGMFGDLSDEQSKWVRNMTNSSVHLIDVVGTILSISRVELGHIKISAFPKDMRRLTQDGIVEIMPLAAEKQVHIDFTPPAEFPLVSLDETIYGQTLHNLLTNAIRYSRPQKGRVTVDIAEHPEGYVLSVRDNGVGIPKDARPHIFERFYRAKNALSIESQGSGLGLYLVKVMTDSYGGRIWFETVVGKGTAFHVLIPRQGMSSI